MTILIHSFILRSLYLDEVGPIRGRLRILRFNEHASSSPANMFMMAGENGQGKTTVLESIGFLMGLLAPGSDQKNEDNSSWWPGDEARMQLDVDVEVEEDGSRRHFMCALTWGKVGSTGMDPERGLQAQDEGDEIEGVSDVQYGFHWVDGFMVRYFASSFHSDERSSHSSSLNLQIIERLKKQIELEAHSLPYGIDIATTLPTVLYFCANRDIVLSTTRERSITRPRRPRYQVLQRFDIDGADWEASLENLLVWLYWLGEHEFSAVVQEANDLVFRGGEGTKRLRKDGLDKDSLQVQVVNGTSIHPLGRLASGEKSLLAFAVRTRVHRTENAIVLLDEPELHLHPRYLERFIELMKKMTANRDLSMVLFTTHSRDALRSFRFEEAERGLAKNAELLLDD